MALTFELNGNKINPPVEWETLKVSAVFTSESLQPSVEEETFTFVDDEAQTLRDTVSRGVSGGPGLLEGVPFNIYDQQQEQSLQVFRGFLDMLEFQNVNGFSVSAPIRDVDSLDKWKG